MKKSLLTVILSMIVLLASGSSFGQMKAAHDPMASETKASALKAAMRKLWEDHIIWTRTVIICLVDDAPGKDQALNRLLQNQVDIGNAMKPFYGEKAGTELTRMLKEHISQAADVVNAAKSGDNAALDAANKKWFANADQICGFLAQANPKWPLADLKMMMKDHLTLTTDVAVQRIKKNYEADIMAFDKVHDEILQMSDMLSYGIISQFPDKFKTDTSGK
jgi:hypothetical protein